jgi:hypothetical protein
LAQTGTTSAPAFAAAAGEEVFHRDVKTSQQFGLHIVHVGFLSFHHARPAENVGDIQLGLRRLSGQRLSGFNQLRGEGFINL